MLLDPTAVRAPNVVAGRIAVVVDDAQWLPAATLERVRGLVEDGLLEWPS